MLLGGNGIDCVHMADRLANRLWRSLVLNRLIAHTRHERPDRHEPIKPPLLQNRSGQVYTTALASVSFANERIPVVELQNFTVGSIYDHRDCSGICMNGRETMPKILL